MKLRCPQCRKAFPWQPDSKWPRYCPLCAYDIGIEDEGKVIEIPPFIRTNGKTAATDKVYRDIERSSEVRAEQAAAHLGVPVSEMADMKVTNMRETPRQGDVAAIPVDNAVSQFMAQNKVGGFQANGVGYSGPVQTGPSPNAGIKTLTGLQNRIAPVMSVPANETLAPGYRRRG